MTVSAHREDRVVAIGPIVRDVTLFVEELPGAGRAATTGRFCVEAGGKGGNPALAAAALGRPVSLLGVVGDDEAATAVLSELDARGVDVGAVRRAAGQTSHIVHLVEPSARRRYVEAPAATLRRWLTEDDVALACGPDDIVMLSTALPAEACLNAVAAARRCGARLVVDAAGEPATVRRVLADTWILRCDAEEGAALAGRRVDDFGTAADAAAVPPGGGLRRSATVSAGAFDVPVQRWSSRTSASLDLSHYRARRSRAARASGAHR